MPWRKSTHCTQDLNVKFISFLCSQLRKDRIAKKVYSSVAHVNVFDRWNTYSTFVIVISTTLFFGIMAKFLLLYLLIMKYGLFEKYWAWLFSNKRDFVISITNAFGCRRRPSRKKNSKFLVILFLFNINFNNLLPCCKNFMPPNQWYFQSLNNDIYLLEWL